MSRDPLSDLLRGRRRRGAVFFYVSLYDRSSKQADRRLGNGRWLREY